MNISRVNAKYRSCNFCQSGKMLKGTKRLTFPYDSVIEVKGNSLVVYYCDECFEKLVKFGDSKK